MKKDSTVEPRKRPRQARSRETYSAILEATAHILEAEGFEAANTNAIAERAGVSVGSLYQYFPDKAAIFAELIRLAEKDMGDMLEKLLEHTAGQTLEVRLGMLLHEGVKQQMSRPRLARTLDSIEVTLPHDEALKGADARLLGLVARLLGEHQHAIARPASTTTALDVLSIAKTIVDGACSAGETDARQLEHRVYLAVLGYLRQPD
jgi:AcrR family transcriptional regulator